MKRYVMQDHTGANVGLDSLGLRPASGPGLIIHSNYLLSTCAGDARVIIRAVASFFTHQVSFKWCPVQYHHLKRRGRRVWGARRWWGRRRWRAWGRGGRGGR